MLRPADLKDDDFWALFQACRAGDLDQVKALILKRPELALREYDYTPPIHFAVREGHLGLVLFLLEQGADPNHRTHPFQDSMLTMAQDREYGEMSQILLQIASCQFPVLQGVAAFLDSARRGDLSHIRTELARDPSLARASNDTGDTALHQAALGRHLDAVNALLDAGANPDAVRSDGWRPINCALARRGGTALHAGVVAGALLARGAAYNIYIAAVIGDLDYVSESLARDPALANYEDTSHYRPISAAARRNDLAMLSKI
jgi:ankyrin repeat protein